MNKVIFLAGIPCTGKTTIFKKLRSFLFVESTNIVYKSLRAIKSNIGNYYMLGVFDGTTFEGTDRLSMCVINDALEYLQKLDKSPEKNVIFVEGDRLFNYRFLTETKSELYIVEAPADLIALRHRLRKDNQTEQFLRSRQTKLENLLKRYPCAGRIRNTNNIDLDLAVPMVILSANKFLNK